MVYKISILAIEDKFFNLQDYISSVGCVFFLLVCRCQVQVAFTYSCIGVVGSVLKI